jgi:hypothetical protein
VVNLAARVLLAALFNQLVLRFEFSGNKRRKNWLFTRATVYDEQRADRMKNRTRDADGGPYLANLEVRPGVYGRPSTL